MTEFISILEELIQLFDHLCEVEQNKLRTVEKNRITILEDCMNEEQAAILRLRGLDVRREKCMERLGFGQKTFKEIMELVSDEERQLLSPLFSQLGDRVSRFQEFSDSAKALIEINLHHINQAIAAQQSDGMKPGSFTNHKV